MCGGSFLDKPTYPSGRSRRDCAALRAEALLGAGVDRVSAVEQADEALHTESCAADPRCVWRAMTTLLCAGELVVADAHWLRLTARLPGAAGVLTLLRARLARLYGDLTGARRLLQTLLRDQVQPPEHGVALPWFIEALVEAGSVDQAGALVSGHDFERLYAAVPGARSLLLAARAAVRLASGRFGSAVDDYLACGRALDAERLDNPAVLPWRSGAALGAKAARRPDLARSLAGAELAAARRWGAPRNVGWALYVQAVVEHREQQLDHLGEAADLLAVAEAGIELGRVSYDLGIRLAEFGDVVAARAALARARALADRCGVVCLGYEVENALRGLVSSSPGPSLTPQEIKIAKLARAGYSNKQISAKLFLSLRTVEFHLSSVYRKLGISGRRELSSATVSFD